MDEPQEHDAKWNKQVPKYTNTVWTYLYEVYKIENHKNSRKVLTKGWERG